MDNQQKTDEQPELKSEAVFAEDLPFHIYYDLNGSYKEMSESDSWKFILDQKAKLRLFDTDGNMIGYKEYTEEQKNIDNNKIERDVEAEKAAVASDPIDKLKIFFRNNPDVLSAVERN